jgi:16S rRNA C967 or C1407 C5-methylase (RsmB/RsmF family)/NOL1/NOP2/fmu family ribosome biogenesis protein
VRILPSAFETRMGTLLGDELPLFIESLQTSPATSIRWNPKKATNPQLEKEVKWAENGSFLLERPKFNHDPLWHAGAYYVQESSSMFVEQFLKLIQLPENAIALDACAAPGGKSTHLLSLLTDDALLICNEVIGKRNQILQENLVKWGNSNYIITQNDIQQFENLQQYFDLVLIDAPCSGEGLFRKDKAAIQEWSNEHVNACAIRQQKILESLAGTVKLNGSLIYSTCTFSEVENENQIQKLLDSGDWELIEFDISEFKEITPGKDGIGFRFYPHKVDGEGYFIAGLKRIRQNIASNYSYSDKYSTKKYEPKSLPLLTAENAAILQKWLKNNILPHVALQFNEWILLFPENHYATLNSLLNQLNITRAGVLAGKILHSQLVPEHPLAVSMLIHESIPTISVNLKDAMLFLQKKTFELPEGNATGWHLVQYQGVNLGWIKALGNRMNNYYPKNWSIQNI